jgi:hypothetical protein
MTQVPVNPPPWGPALDPHFAATQIGEGLPIHSPANQQQAAERGWFWRREWYMPLEPDTRRCWIHGETMFDPDTGEEVRT